ncbi:MAG: exosome complex RNA-binding protein Rrp4 [Desulfurococcaceae archaeon]
MKLKTLVADRQIVRPGDVLAVVEDEEVKYARYPDKHVFIMNSKVYADVVGLASIGEGSVSVIPLEGTYIPRKDDLVIGVVTGVGITAWILDINSPYKAVLPGEDVVEGFNPAVHELRGYLDLGDYVLAKVAEFDRTRDPLLTIRGKGLGKIIDGTVVKVRASKVPRLIGRKGSMYNLLTSATGCDITIAQNGLVRLKCNDERTIETLVKAIRIIESKSHIRGLTEEIKAFLERELGARSDAKAHQG